MGNVNDSSYSCDRELLRRVKTSKPVTGSVLLSLAIPASCYVLQNGDPRTLSSSPRMYLVATRMIIDEPKRHKSSSERSVPDTGSSVTRSGGRDEHLCAVAPRSSGQNPRARHTNIRPASSTEPPRILPMPALAASFPCPQMCRANRGVVVRPPVSVPLAETACMAAARARVWSPVPAE